MKKKLIGIIICMLLLVTTIPITGHIISNKIIKKEYEDDTLSNGDKWIKIFGDRKPEYGRTVYQTDDGGYIILGGKVSNYYKNFSVWLIKTDDTGNKQWDKIFDDAIGISVKQTLDGGYIILARTFSFENPFFYNNSIWLIRTDDLGNMLWEKILKKGGLILGGDVISTSDENFLIVGGCYNNSETKNHDAWLLKINDNGEILWEKSYGGEDHEFGLSVGETFDNGYILTGATSLQEGESSYVLLLKTDQDGVLLWEKNLVGGVGENMGNSIQTTNDGGFIITGIRNFDILIVKTNSNGEMLWERSYGESLFNYGYSVDQTDDGGYIIAGGSNKRGSSNMYGVLIKTDSDGIVEWISNFDNYKWSEFYSVQQTLDGGYILTGSQFSGLLNTDVLLIKTDSNGNVPNNRRFNRPLPRLFERFIDLFPILKMFFQ